MRRSSNSRDTSSLKPCTPAGRFFLSSSPNWIRFNSTPASLAGFLSLMLITAANHATSPLRDSFSLSVGVHHIPTLTLCSTLLALGSSVPVGWLFEAPDPERRRVWKRLGLTRGETQGTSLALFLRSFAIFLLLYAVVFKVDEEGLMEKAQNTNTSSSIAASIVYYAGYLVGLLGGKIGYCIFYLVVHLLKLHSISLVWGVTSEAMEYEEMTEVRQKRMKSSSERGSKNQNDNEFSSTSQSASKGGRSQTRARLSRLGFVGFGGTLGQILGGIMASLTSKIFRISGLLLWSAIFLELSAQLSVELGRIMQRHWEEQQRINSCADLASMIKKLDEDGNSKGNQDRNAQTDDVDSSIMKRSPSHNMGMKRVGSGNSLALKRANSTSSLTMKASFDKGDNQSESDGTGIRPSSSYGNFNNMTKTTIHKQPVHNDIEDSTFASRLVRGINTIVKSRLLMTIFTFNALYASTNVLLSFQRAELVAIRSKATTTTAIGRTKTETDTAFLARINIASSIAVFILQASGVGAALAANLGPRGTLTIMPIVRMVGILLLAWWHVVSAGNPPNLMLFLALDELCRVINLAVAKPVRENLWRGLSNEARYEAKPLVDTLANRWGGGSAAFLVKFVDQITMLLGLNGSETNGSGKYSNATIFGFPPVLILCLIVSIWWAVVSMHLGFIRNRIDLELKKNQ